MSSHVLGIRCCMGSFALNSITKWFDSDIKRAISWCFTALLHKMTIMLLIIYPGDLSANYAQLASGGGGFNRIQCTPV